MINSSDAIEAVQSGFCYDDANDLDTTPHLWITRYGHVLWRYLPSDLKGYLRQVAMKIKPSVDQISIISCR